MTIEEAGELILSGAKPWLACISCKAAGRIRDSRKDEVLTDCMGNDTDILSTSTGPCHRCNDRGWFPNHPVWEAYGVLEMPIPPRPERKKISCLQKR